tara:strand:- start:1734 stop:2099 length:366 start_codon:yes stop_codon:yes gene_type:complete
MGAFDVTLLDLLKALVEKDEWQPHSANCCVLELTTETSSGEPLRWVFEGRGEKDSELRLEQYFDGDRMWRVYENTLWSSATLPEPVLEQLCDARDKIMYGIANRQVANLGSTVFKGFNFSY